MVKRKKPHEYQFNLDDPIVDEAMIREAAIKMDRGAKVRRTESAFSPCRG
jgi:hypothetical protein